MNLPREIRRIRAQIIRYDNQCEIARQTGLTQTTIHRFVIRDRHSCNTDTLQLLFDFFQKEERRKARRNGAHR